MFKDPFRASVKEQLVNEKEGPIRNFREKERTTEGKGLFRVFVKKSAVDQ